MIAPSELLALRVPLAALEGLDPLGLRPYKRGSDAVYEMVVGRWESKLYLSMPALARSEVVDGADVELSTADARTRDALARWVAGRCGMQLGATAPVLRVGELTAGGCFVELSSYIPLGEGRITTRSRRWLARNPGHLFTPEEALPELFVFEEGHDPRLLPDGSRWVDAAALAAVARHVGGLK